MSRTWADVSAGLGRRDMPHALVYAVIMDEVITDPEEVAIGIESAWVSTEWPLSAADPDVWLNVWSYATDDGLTYLEGDQITDIANLPETLTVYRGAAPGYERGMSWTTDLERARWFANRFNQGHEVFVAEVPREAVLARFGRRGEDEVVIDPDYLPEDVDDMTRI